jgi:hypothetical protein
MDTPDLPIGFGEASQILHDFLSCPVCTRSPVARTTH